MGAVLPGDFKIKEAKIRGELSCGMLCSKKELGLEEKSEGIWILDKKQTIGTKFSDVLGKQDQCFEVNVTPNRADCLSHYGLARELSCLLENPLNLQKLKFQESLKKK